MSPKPASKAQLLQDIRAQHERLEDLLQGLSGSDMVKAEAAGKWTAKDILAHITTWEKFLLNWYQTGLRGEEQVMPDWKTPGIIDEINRGIYERNLDRELADVVTEYRASYDLTLKTVEAIPEEDMFVPGKYQWLGGAALVDWIVGNTSGHYAEHINMLNDIRKKLGK